MKKYAVIEVRGDIVRTLELFETKEAARGSAQLLREKCKGQNCGIHTVYGEIDENGNLDKRGTWLIL